MKDVRLCPNNCRPRKGIVTDMIRNRYTVCYFAVIPVWILLTALLIFFWLHAQEYVKADGLLLDKRQLREASQILDRCGRDTYRKRYGEINQEYQDLSEYIEISEADVGGAKAIQISRRYTKEQIEKILARYPYSTEEAIRKKAVLQYCLLRLTYAIGYPDYISGMLADAALRSEMEIFDADTRKRLAGMVEDYKWHVNIRISAQADVGAGKFLADRIVGVSLIAMALLSAFFYCMSRRAAGAKDVIVKSRAGLFAAYFCFGAVFLYIVGAWIYHAAFGLGDLARPIQSIRAFSLCPFLISVGGVLVTDGAFKVLAALTLYLLCVGLIFLKRRVLAALLAGALCAAETAMNVKGFSVSFYAFFCVGERGMRYENLRLFGKDIGLIYVQAAALLILFAAALAFAAREMNAEIWREKERAEKAYFDEINEKYAEARFIRHDIHNHLTAVAMLLDEGKVEDARAYLSTVSGELENARPEVKTGSAVLDAVLFAKIRAAKEGGVEVNIRFETDFAGSGIADYDLCSVFGNLLDNAKEACAALPEGERVITLSVKRQMDMIMIFCRNRYDKLRKENGGFATLKTDRKLHGLGLRQIGRIAAKYGGSLEIETGQGEFSASVLLHAAARKEDKL